MPVRADLHGRLTVELPVPRDVQAKLGKKKLSRIVRPEKGETWQSVQASLRNAIDEARGTAPLRVVIVMDARSDAQSLARIEEAIASALTQEDMLDLIDNAKIRFEKPHRG